MKKTFILASITIRELIRSKVLYAIFALSGLLLLCATFFGTVTIGSQTKVIKDFALFLTSLSSAGLAIFSGTSLLNKELSKKTIYNILSKPVRRTEFILGKFFGMLFVCTLIILIMLPTEILYISIFEGRFDLHLMIAALYFIAESIILCAAALFFSSIVVTPALAGVLVFALFLAGRSSESLIYFIQSPETSSITKNTLTILYWILPQLNRLNVSDLLVYGYIPPLAHMISGLTYASAYATILLIISTIIFNKKEFN